MNSLERDKFTWKRQIQPTDGTSEQRSKWQMNKKFMIYINVFFFIMFVVSFTFLLRTNRIVHLYTNSTFCHSLLSHDHWIPNVILCFLFLLLLFFYFSVGLIYVNWLAKGCSFFVCVCLCKIFNTVEIGNSMELLDDCMDRVWGVWES